MTHALRNPEGAGATVHMRSSGQDALSVRSTEGTACRGGGGV